MLELPIYLVVLCAMGIVSAVGFVYAQRHLHALDAVYLMAGPRATMMEYKAMTGIWPTSNVQAGFSDAMIRGGEPELYRMNSVQIREGGAVDFEISRGALKGKTLSIRAWESSRPGLPVEWVCGLADAPQGTTAAALDRTTLSKEDLPSPCRAHK